MSCVIPAHVFETKVKVGKPSLVVYSLQGSDHSLDECMFTGPNTLNFQRVAISFELKERSAYITNHYCLWKGTGRVRVKPWWIHSQNHSSLRGSLAKGAFVGVVIHSRLDVGRDHVFVQVLIWRCG